MTEVAKKIREIAVLGLERPLKQVGFRRHSTNFSRTQDEALHVINIQSSKWNSGESGRFTVNAGAHFPKIASLIYGKDPMPANPKEFHCLVRTRVGMLMPEGRDHWWPVTPGTNVEEVAREIADVCSEYVLPWLASFASISNIDWALSRRSVLQNTWMEAAASLALGDRKRALQCVKNELVSIETSSAYSDPANAKLKKSRIAELRKWAANQGLIDKHLEAV
jgi:hypothetical protein